MLGLPKATELSKPLPKKAIFDKFKLSTVDRRLFDEQISRLSIVAEISPQTVSIAAGENVDAVYTILITLKTPQCNKRNITLLSGFIDRCMLFILQYEGEVQLAACRAGKVLISERKPINAWNISLTGLDLNAVWENILAAIGGIELTEHQSLDEILTANERREMLKRQIIALEKKIQREKQFNLQVEMNAELKKLKVELEVMKKCE